MNVELFPIENYKNKIPKNKKGIYFFYDVNKELIYIGKSENIYSRINQYFSYHSVKHLHYKFKKFVKYMSFKLVDTDLKNIEKELIQKHRPDLNVQYNEKYTQRYSEKYETVEEKHEDEEMQKRIDETLNNFRLG